MLLFKDIPIIAGDLETNGKFNKLTQPIEMCFKVYHPDGRIEKIHHYIKCKYRLPWHIIEMTGITDQKLKDDGIEVEKASYIMFDLFHSRFKEYIFVGHNLLRFDLLFCNYYIQMFNTLKYVIQKSACFDTLAQLKAEKNGLLKPDKKTYGDWHHDVIYKGEKTPELSLDAACEYYGITRRNAHTAEGDTDAAYDVFVKQVAFIEQQQNSKLSVITQ